MRAASAVEFWGSELRELKIILPGTRELHDALRALAWTTVDRGWVSTVLVWGRAGTGKTMLPLSLHQALVFAGLEFSLLTIDCSRFGCLSGDDEKNSLELVESIVRGASPLLLAVNHVELLHRSSNPPLRALFELLIGILSSEQNEAGILALLPTSRPDLVDRQIRIDYRAYCPMPDMKSTAQLLYDRGELGIQDPEIANRISEELFRIGRDLNVMFSARSVFKAARALKALPLPAGASPHETAQWIFASCNLVPRADVDEFERKNEKLILQSRDFVESWKVRYRSRFDENDRCTEIPERLKVASVLASTG